MVNSIPESVKKIWYEWNIRGVILFSLLLQTVLILFAPLRKGMGYKLIMFLIWSAYLLADSAANFGFGLVSEKATGRSQTPDPSQTPYLDDVGRIIAERAIGSQIPGENNELFVLWAPFLLLHLGGPDTITSFALEDNELWLRQLVGFISQAGFTFYIFFMLLPRNKLFISTILMFVVGIIKCLERTRALYLASDEQFRNSTFFELAFENDDVNQDGDCPEVIASQYLKYFKGIIIDLYSSFKDHSSLKGPSFGNLSPKKALRIIEVELNLVYEVLHTKIQVTHSVLGIILRFICFGSVVAAFSIFCFQVDKHGFNEIDVGVTYTLFVGAIALDILSFFRLLFSDFTFVALWNHHQNCIAAIVRWFIGLKSSRWQRSHSGGKHEVFVFATPFLFRRWSGSVSGLSIIKARPSKSYGIDKFFQIIVITTYKVIRFLQIDKIIACFGHADIANEIRIKSSLSQEPLTKELWVFIFKEMKRKTEYVDEIRTMVEALYHQEEHIDPETGIRIPTKPPHNPEEHIRKALRTKFTAEGDCTLEELDTKGDLIKFMKGLPEKYNYKFSFDKSLTLWHLATELLYGETAKEVLDEKTFHARENSKILSDYMLYLLVLMPTMVNPKEKVELETLRGEAKLWFGTKRISGNQRMKLNLSKNRFLFDDAKMLVEELQKFEYKDTKWEIVSKVWVELLSYAACQSSKSPRTHLQLVSNGGELITFVWVLMAHFGLVEPKLED